MPISKIDEITSIKMKFNRYLEPIKVMLINKKSKLDEKEWGALVGRTQESVVRCPDQYLGRDLPKPEILKALIGEIFLEFYEREYQY